MQSLIRTRMINLTLQRYLKSNFIKKQTKKMYQFTILLNHYIIKYTT